MIMNYNWITLFQRLPLDIQRLIFEYDDTYRFKFTSPHFKNQILYKHWQRETVSQYVRELVYQRLEFLIMTKTFWNPDNCIFNAMDGKLFISRIYQEIDDVRKEVYVYLTPYKNYLRWKLIPSASNLRLYDERKMLYDGFIGDQSNIENDPKIFQSMFFGNGRMRGNGLEPLEVPEWCRHIGDTYWC